MLDNLELPSEKIKVSYIKSQDLPKVELSLNKKQIKLLVRIAAILHDIGHGPFSHVFEKAVTEMNLPELEKLYPIKQQRQIQLHEKIGVEIIFDQEKSISHILDNFGDEDLRGHTKYLVKDILEGQLDPFWIKEIISGQFDCDRIDYLLRDAYMCGVTYASFDWKWIFNNIELSNKTPLSSKGSEPFEYRLVINGTKGIYSLESFLISRFHMHEQVYFHKTTQCLEAVVKRIFKRVYYLYKNNSESEFDVIVPFLDKSFIKFLNDPLNIAYYLKLDDTYMLTHFDHWAVSSKDPILRELCKCIIFRNTFKLFQTFADSDVQATYKDVDEISHEELSKLNISLTADEKDYYVIVDTKDNKVYKTNSNDQIYVKTKDGIIRTINEESQIIKNLPLKTSICRSFHHKELSAKFAERYMSN
jgi:uncharacterized protein